MGVISWINTLRWRKIIVGLTFIISANLASTATAKGLLKPTKSLMVSVDKSKGEELTDSKKELLKVQLMAALEAKYNKIMRLLKEGKYASANAEFDFFIKFADLGNSMGLKKKIIPFEERLEQELSRLLDKRKKEVKKRSKFDLPEGIYSVSGDRFYVKLRVSYSKGLMLIDYHKTGFPFSDEELENKLVGVNPKVAEFIRREVFKNGGTSKQYMRFRK